MCGINGILSTKSANVEHIGLTLDEMNSSIHHRGPDDFGSYVQKFHNFSLAMGMTRLAIIDLNTGHQPIFNEDKSLAIVFNGEIYNYQVLRNELISEGVKFSTTSDTEVVLKLYETRGVKSFGELDGMFAFSIFDKKKGKVYIARDYFGEKPLYYTKCEERFIWGSELKSVLLPIEERPNIDLKGLSLYFQLTYIPAPFTIYEGIYKLRPNHFLEVDCATAQYEENVINENVGFSEDLNKDKGREVNQVRKLVEESVLSRTVSDVPVGAFLSGGVDSSIVALCLSKNVDYQVDTFSIGFADKKFDESDKARTVASIINSKHHEFVVSENDFKANVDKVLLNFDEPFADSSALASDIVSSKAAQYVKVALTGDGGDEVFGGYNKYYMGMLNNRYTSLVPEGFHNTIFRIASPFMRQGSDSRGLKFKLRRMLESVSYEDDYYLNIISLGFRESELDELLQCGKSENAVLDLVKDIKGDSLTGFREIDKRLSLEGDMLVKVDRTAMLNSLETRAPFLNRSLWEYTSRLPQSALMKGWDKKHILKKAFQSDFPDNFLNLSKQGFGVPVGNWLKSSMKEELLYYCEEELLRTQELFNKDYISKMVYDHLSGAVDNTFRVWTFFCFQKWYFKTYMSLS